MQTFIDPIEFCDCVLAEAKAQGWELNLQQINVPMRWRWQWTWKGAHPLPSRDSMFPGRAQALLAACAELVRQTAWPLQLDHSVPPPMELVQPACLESLATAGSPALLP